jgi:dipeptidyl aminopeptidase/acylaminoacyl peptidase
MGHRHSVLPILPLVLFLLISSSSGQSKRPLALEDMFRIKRIAKPSLSPDGKWVAFTVTLPDKNANRNTTYLWRVSVNGERLQQVVDFPVNDEKATWSPDARWIAFETKQSGKSQIWLVDPEKREPRQFSHLSTEAADPLWSPDGTNIAYVSEVFPEFSDKPFATSDSLNKKKLDDMERNPVKAKIFTGLLFRHWDSWVNGKRKHIFVQPVGGGDPKDITPGDRDAVPTSTTFSAGIDYAFSPDGRELAYTATPVPVHEEAWSTNHAIYTVPVQGGTPTQITSNPAADGYPCYSPNGKYIAYRAQSVPGFEADRWQLMLYDRSRRMLRSLTENFDASVGSPRWSPQSDRLYFDSEEKGIVPIFSVSVAGNEVKKIFEMKTCRDINITPDGTRLIVAICSATRPVELYSVGTDGRNLKNITGMNDGLFDGLDIPPPESIWFNGAEGTKVQAWIFVPPKFDPQKKYPFVYMVHGGPQGSWLDTWSYRWNAALWAAQGYVIMAPNPRGSTGFGQRFTNEISGDWGGKVFVDLMKGLDYAEALPYVDRERKAAAGASFGGYMMNWFQANAGNRFKTFITHDGVYNFESMYGTTEEVWFDEWDHGGTPWDKPEGYRKFSPHNYAQKFNTPNLIIHSELDFRVPFSEGMQLFTVLQRKGIPSKLLYFPDEGHIISKPGNSELWHKTVFGWLADYLKPHDGG